MCKDYKEDWLEFIQKDVYSPLSDWLLRIGSENKQAISVEETEALYKALS